MTQIHKTRPHSTTSNANRRRGGSPNSGRVRSLGLVYDGVTAAYIRDIATQRRPGDLRRAPAAGA
jgi:hypothetical protein